MLVASPNVIKTGITGNNFPFGRFTSQRNYVVTTLPDVFVGCCVLGFYCVCVCVCMYVCRFLYSMRYKLEGRGFDSQCYWNPSARTMSLGSTQPVTEMSTRNISWGVKAADA
jgi:hypothetical protein